MTDKPNNSSQHIPWLGGLVLIVLGIVFLVQNLSGFTLANWWALFILIPAAGSFSAAWRIYRNSGNRLTQAAAGPLTGGVILATVAAVFLLNLDWGVIWPVFVILAGLGALLGAFLGRE